MATLDETFAADRSALAAACERVSEGVLATQYPSRALVSERLRLVAAMLHPDRPWEKQASAAASLRGLIHCDGFAEWPDPPKCHTWNADLRLLWDLSTIFVETRYREIAAQQAPSVGTGQQTDNGA